MDFKRLQSTIFSNYNRGAFCSGNSTIMQLGAEKVIATVGCGGLCRAVGREGKDKTKQGKATSRRKSKAQEV